MFAKRMGLVAMLLASLVGCGKNDAVVPVGQLPPPMQAPPPPNYNPPAYPPGGGGGYPPGGGGGYYPPPQQQPQPPMGFRPQLPPQMPPQYYPFLPIDNFMRQSPQMQQYWAYFWGQWQGYAQRRGVNPYDFTRFWFDYCPQQWGYGEFQQLYSYFDQNFYYWVTPQTYFSQNIDASYFWANCDAYPYPQQYYDLCDSGCY